MDQDSVHMVAASKVPMIKPVIENGNAPPITKVVETIIAPATTEEKAQRRLELKARNTLLMGISNEHQLKFNSIKDAKSLLQAVKNRFGGNAATKKTQRNLLKQQYEIFTTSSSEVLDQTFDRLQKLISQLEIHGESISQEDVNQKFLRSLLSERNTHTIVRRNKPEINTLSLDDLYNNLKIYEPEGHFARECKALRSQDTKHKESIRRTVPVETPTSAVLVSCDELGGYDWSDQAEEGLTNFALMAYSSTSSNSEGNKQIDLHNKRVIENGCSRHMTGNMSYLTDYKEIDRCYISFGGNPKRGKITGRGSGLNWLFDINALTKSTNYKPVVVENQSNGNACTKACYDACKARMETVPGKDYILLPLWTADPLISQESKSSQDDGFQPSSDDGKKVDKDPRQESECKDQENEDNVDSTNNVNGVGTNGVNAIGANTNNELPFDIIKKRIK
nr:hypothetical protein [Tanacetum cinerariifolium]